MNKAIKTATIVTAGMIGLLILLETVRNVVVLCFLAFLWALLVTLAIIEE